MFPQQPLDQNIYVLDTFWWLHRTGRSASPLVVEAVRRMSLQGVVLARRRRLSTGIASAVRRLLVDVLTTRRQLGLQILRAENIQLHTSTLPSLLRWEEPDLNLRLQIQHSSAERDFKEVNATVDKCQNKDL